jgi:hypothetical protein
VQEVSAAANRAAAESTIKQFDFEQIAELPRERLMEQLAGIVAELPQ